MFQQLQAYVGAHLTYAHAQNSQTFLTFIGERERAVQLALIYIGTVHTVHVRMRGNYVKRLRDIKISLPFSKREAAESGRCVYHSAELDIHVVRRRERLATETTEETDTPVPALCSIHAY